MITEFSLFVKKRAAFSQINLIAKRSNGCSAKGTGLPSDKTKELTKPLGFTIFSANFSEEL